MMMATCFKVLCSLNWLKSAEYWPKLAKIVNQLKFTKFGSEAEFGKHELKLDESFHI